MTDKNSKDTEQDRVAWWCRYCLENVGTQGDEPGECPTCGHSDGWDKLANRPLQTAKERCEMAMDDVKYIEGSDTRITFESHLQHIHAALGGDKEDLYD